MRIRTISLMAAIAVVLGSTGCCSWCDKHCSECHQPPPGYVPAGYVPAAGCAPAPACCPPANACAPGGAAWTAPARSSPIQNCGCAQY
jgi:hypothetical protein